MICRETAALSPGGGIALLALRPFCLHPSPVLPGGSESICRETVALSPGTSRAPVHSLRGTSCHSRLLRCRSCGFRLLRCLPSAIGFYNVCLRQKHGSHLGHASLTACTVCPARHICESEASRLLRTEHVPEHVGTCQCKSICIALGFCVFLHFGSKVKTWRQTVR